MGRGLDPGAALLSHLHTSQPPQVRKKLKEPRVDTELVYAFAKVGQTGQLEEFINGTHQANLQACGDRWV